MIFPSKLKRNDEMRIISPAMSLSIISESVREIANRRFEEIGLKISFSEHSEESDEVKSSSIESRIEDFHEAFKNPSVKIVMTTIGGFNSNQLLPILDYELIKNNPKIICGYSDITALSNAIYAKTGLVTYSGPSYSSFGEEIGFEYTLEYFKKCLFNEEPFEVVRSLAWSNDKWYMNQKDRNFTKNEGLWILNEGEARGIIVGGNLCTLNLLQGTEFMPELDGTILFLEDDASTNANLFDRDLESLTQLPKFGGVRGIVFGRFENESKMSRKNLERIISGKKKLNNIPIIGNADFGHIEPKVTFPIGGIAEIKAKKMGIASIRIIEH